MRTFEPVLVRTAIVSALTAALHVAVILGWLPIDEEAEVAIAGLFDLVGVAIAAVWSRSAVIPVAKIEEAVRKDAAITPSGEVIESSHEGVVYDESTREGSLPV